MLNLFILLFLYIIVLLNCLAAIGRVAVKNVVIIISSTNGVSTIVINRGGYRVYEKGGTDEEAARGSGGVL